MSKAAPQNKHQEFLQNSDQLLVQLLRAAKAGDKNDAVVIDAATRAKAKTALNSEQKALNSMASIIGGGGSGAVGAVCHDGGKLLLSTNRPDEEGKVRKLFTLIKEKDHDQLRQEVYSHAVLNVERHFSEPLFSNHLSELKAIMGGGKKLTKNLIKQVANYSEIQNSQQKIKALEELSLMANKVLTTYEDTLRKRVGLRNFLTDLRTPAKHIERVTRYNTGEKAELFTREPQFVAQENTHAEMNIINELFMQGKLLEERQFFIGDTKKCCASCHIVVTSVNKTLPNKIEMSGTHGTAYIPWQKPEFLRLNEQALKDALAVRGHQPGQINVLVKLAADINLAFEANMKDLITEVQARSTQPLSERQARSVSPLASSEEIIHQPQEITQEEREQKNLVDKKRRNAQKLNGELSVLRNSFNLLQGEEEKLPRLKENLNKILRNEENLSSRLIIIQNNINKCIQIQGEQEKEEKIQQELYRRYELQLQKTQEVWAESPEGAVQNAATTEINRVKELLIKAQENWLAAKKKVESTLNKYKEFEQVLQDDKEGKEKLSLEKTKIEKEITNLNTKIEEARETIKNKSDEMTKVKVELKEAEEKLIQTRSKKEEPIELPPKNYKKRRIKGSEKEEPPIKKAKTDEGELKPKDASSPIEFPGQQAAIGNDTDAKKREEVEQKFSFAPLAPPKQTQKPTTPPQTLIVISKEIEPEKTEKVVKQRPTSTQEEGTQKQAEAIGKEVKPFIAVVAPAQSGDKGKRKIPPQSISKRGKGRSGARGKY